MSSDNSLVVWYHGAGAPYRMKLSTMVGMGRGEEPSDLRNDPLVTQYSSWWELAAMKLSELPEADRLSLVQYNMLLKS